MIKVEMFLSFDDDISADLEDVEWDIKEAVRGLYMSVERIKAERVEKINLHQQTTTNDYTGEEVVQLDKDGNRTVLGTLSDVVSLTEEQEEEDYVRARSLWLKNSGRENK